MRFYNHPIRALIYDRAGLWITKPDETPDEQIPVSLSDWMPGASGSGS